MTRWNAQEQGRVVWDDQGKTVATVQTGNKADARLIAAAPELLAALTELVERAEAEGNVDGLPEYEQARAALAKAKA